MGYPVAAGGGGTRKETIDLEGRVTRGHGLTYYRVGITAEQKRFGKEGLSIPCPRSLLRWGGGTDLCNKYRLNGVENGLHDGNKEDDHRMATNVARIVPIRLDVDESVPVNSRSFTSHNGNPQCVGKRPNRGRRGDRRKHFGGGKKRGKGVSAGMQCLLTILVATHDISSGGTTTHRAMGFSSANPA